MHCLSVFSLIVMAAVGMETLSSARERQMGGVGITVFTDCRLWGSSPAEELIAQWPPHVLFHSGLDGNAGSEDHSLLL
jgi:hypothetical protein